MHVLPPTFETCLATNQVVTGCVNTVVSLDKLGTLRSDNGDAHEKVAEKQTSHHFKLFRDYPNSPCYMLLKRGGFWLELERGERAQVQTEMVEFVALPFPLPSKLKIRPFHVVVVQ